MSAPTNMPTPSNGGAATEWTPRLTEPARSVFGNYTAAAKAAGPTEAGEMQSDAVASSRLPANSLGEPLEVALARSFLYRFLAKAFEDPTPEGWGTLISDQSREALRTAVAVLESSAPRLATAAKAFEAELTATQFDEFLSAYLSAFGHAARGRCPLNEVEYGDIKADPLFQPHRLADLAAFYRAFGLEVAADAGERHDHICLELEFMCVLAAKEGFVLQCQAGADVWTDCRAAEKQFLRDHLGRWAPAFARRLAALAGDGALQALARLTGAFIASECVRFGVTPGSEDLLLRPVDEAAESLCASCGTRPLAPGVAPECE